MLSESQFCERKVELEHILMNIGISIYNLIFLFFFSRCRLYYILIQPSATWNTADGSAQGGGGYKSDAALSGVSGIAGAGVLDRLVHLC